MLFILTFAFLLALSWAFPQDVVIRFERSVSVNGTVVEKVLVWDARLKERFDKRHVTLARPIQDEVLKRMVESNNETTGYGTYIRLRECRLRGCRVLQLSDRFQFNGRDYLTLDSETDSWTEAYDLKRTWTFEAEHASLEKIHLKEECEEFIKQMNDHNNEGVGMLGVMAPVLATFLFIVIIFISVLIYKQHGQQPGGVLGSIIHYPAHNFEVPFDGQSCKNIQC